MTKRCSWLRYRYQFKWCFSVWMWWPRWTRSLLYGDNVEILDLGPLEIYRRPRKQEAPDD